MLHTGLLNMRVWLLLSRWLHALTPLKTTPCKLIDCSNISSLFIIKVKSIKKAENQNKTNKASSTLNSFIGRAVLTTLSLWGHCLYWQKLTFCWNGLYWLSKCNELGKKNSVLLLQYLPWKRDSPSLTLSNYYWGSDSYLGHPIVNRKR